MTSWRRIAPAVAVFLVVFGIYVDSKVTTSFDSRWTLHEAASLVRRGDLDLEEYRPLVAPDDYRVVEVPPRRAVRPVSRQVPSAAQGGAAAMGATVRPRLRSYFPPGTTLLAAPFVAVADLVSGGEVARRLVEREPRREDHKLEKAIASLLAALAATLFFLLARNEVQPSVALVATAAFAFATPAWSLASRGLWQHGPLMLLLTAALLFLAWGERRPAWTVASALPLAFGFVVRPTAAVALVVFAGWVGLRHPRRLPAWLALATAVLAPFALWSQAVFGTWLPPYYGAGRLALHPDFVQALAANLVSPARGLLIYAPVVLLAPVGLALARARRCSPHPPVALAAEGGRAANGLPAAVAALLWWPLVSSFPHWWAGHAYGPRFLAETVPLWLYVALPAFAAALRPPSGPHRRRHRRALQALLAVTLAWGAWINHRGARDWAPWHWDETPVDVDVAPQRVWDWTDPPFLR